MTYHFTSRHWLPLLIGVCALLALAGCGGGGSTGGGNGLTLANPVHDATKPTSIGGTVITLANGVMDYPYNADVVLTRLPDTPTGAATELTTAHTNPRGSFSFGSLAEGAYQVDVYSPSRAAPTLSGRLTGVHPLGNIPLLMQNILIGAPDGMATIHGVITQGGSPAANASTTLEIAAYNTEHLKDGTDNTTVMIMLNSTTDAQGNYSYFVPVGAVSYILSAHSATSMVTAMSNRIVTLEAFTTQEHDLDLVTAETPVFSDTACDVVSSTLAEPTGRASQQAMITRMAATRARHGTAAQLARLEKLATLRTATRALGGLVENDLYWDVISGDVGVQGFHIYRNTAATGKFIQVGTTYEPYQMYFYDNDPALAQADKQYYTIASYAAKDQVSPPSGVIVASPLPMITVTAPADGATVARADATLSWQPVPGASSYLVMIYTAEPAYNLLPFQNTEIPANETSTGISGLPAGDYWWAVSAYNTADPLDARSTSYSLYRKVTLTESVSGKK